MTVQTKSNLLVRATQIRNETAGFANSEIRVGSLLQDMIDTALPTPSGLMLNDSSASAKTNNTTLIQAAIDAAHAAYLAGSGVALVELPVGNIFLAASTLAETYYNDGVAVPASDACLSMRDGVTLRGQGIGRTKLVPTSPSTSTLHIIDGNHQVIENLEINGASATSTEVGHGILQLLSANNNSIGIESLRVENVHVRQVGSYGMGLENGIMTKVQVINFSTYRTGADGIDIKNRGTTEDNNGWSFRGIYIDTFGLRLDDQAGVDIRGIVDLHGVQVINAGRAGVQQTAIRFRPREPISTEAWARRSSIHGFYVRGTNAAFNTIGVWVGAPDVNVSGGVTETCIYGVRVVGETGDVERVSVVGVVVRTANTKGFWADTTYGVTTRTTFVGCTAHSCGIGFQDDGTFTTIVGCHAYSCTTTLASAGGSLQSQALASNDFQADFLALLGSATGNPAIDARGTDADINIWLSPKGAGRVRFGVRTASVDVPVTGYVEIVDHGGTVRRLAVVG